MTTPETRVTVDSIDILDLEKRIARLRTKISLVENGEQSHAGSIPRQPMTGRIAGVSTPLMAAKINMLESIMTYIEAEAIYGIDSAEYLSLLRRPSCVIGKVNIYELERELTRLTVDVVAEATSYGSLDNLTR